MHDYMDTVKQVEAERAEKPALAGSSDLGEGKPDAEYEVAYVDKSSRVAVAPMATRR